MHVLLYAYRGVSLSVYISRVSCAGSTRTPEDRQRGIAGEQSRVHVRFQAPFPLFLSISQRPRPVPRFFPERGKEKNRKRPLPFCRSAAPFPNLLLFPQSSFHWVPSFYPASGFPSHESSSLLPSIWSKGLKAVVEWGGQREGAGKTGKESGRNSHVVQLVLSLTL